MPVFLLWHLITYLTASGIFHAHQLRLGNPWERVRPQRFRAEQRYWRQVSHDTSRGGQVNWDAMINLTQRMREDDAGEGWAEGDQARRQISQVAGLRDTPGRSRGHECTCTNSSSSCLVPLYPHTTYVISCGDHLQAFSFVSAC